MRTVRFRLLLLLAAVFCLGPYVWQVITSLKPDAELTAIPPLLPVHPTLEHYASIFRDASFLRIFLNSFVVAGFTTLLALVIGSSAAFALAKLNVRRKGLLMALVLAVSMFPPIVTVSPIYLIIRALGLRDTWWALVATHTTFSLPLAIWVLTNFFREIPHELFLASRVDGCTPLQSFLRVFMPLAAPGVFATAILVFIFSWNEFLFALTLTSTLASRTIPVGIALFPGLHEIPWGDIAAASCVVTIPLIVLVALFQRRIVEGLTAGAVKG